MIVVGNAMVVPWDMRVCDEINVKSRWNNRWNDSLEEGQVGPGTCQGNRAGTVLQQQQQQQHATPTKEEQWWIFARKALLQVMYVQPMRATVMYIGFLHLPLPWVPGELHVNEGGTK